MCWNPEISITTFAFALASFLAAYYHGYPSKYLLFFMTFSSMQLVEFFMWLSLRNDRWNTIFSIIGAIVIFLEPIMAINILDDGRAKTILYVTYCLWAIVFVMWMIERGWDFSTIRGADGHLRWNWLQIPLWVASIWVVYLLVPLFIAGNYAGFAMASIILAYSVYNYATYGTWGSYWCYFSALIGAIYTVLWVVGLRRF